MGNQRDCSKAGCVKTWHGPEFGVSPLSGLIRPAVQLPGNYWAAVVSRDTATVSPLAGDNPRRASVGA